MFDKARNEAEDDLLEDPEQLTERPVFYGIRNDPRFKFEPKNRGEKYEGLIDEIFDPNPLRSHVVTLHLFVEYWLNQLLETRGKSSRGIKRLSFKGKVDALAGEHVLDNITHVNIVIINKIRNLYAHELNLADIEGKVAALLDSIEIIPMFNSSDDDHFRAMCVQTMFVLEATCASGQESPLSRAFLHDEVKSRLLQRGWLHWSECELLKEDRRGQESIYTMKCPLCPEGVIGREKNHTPGFQDSHIFGCKACGLTALKSQTQLDLEAAFKKFGGSR